MTGDTFNGLLLFLSKSKFLVLLGLLFAVCVITLCPMKAQGFLQRGLTGELVTHSSLMQPERADLKNWVK